MELSANGGKEMKFSFLIALGIILASTTTYAQNSGTAVLKFPQDIEFKGPADKPQTAILYGDPTKPGVFVTRIKFPPGYKDMPHWHPDELRTVAVLSGTLYFANGDKWDESKLKPYPAGTFYSEPAQSHHYSWAKDGEVILQLTGIGPSGKTYIPQ
jgi:quercetin dioxygenase-like cupin family protein